MKFENEIATLRIENLVRDMKDSGKVIKIAARFEEADFPLDKQKTRHFETAEYLWCLKEIRGVYYYVGLLLDSSLEYIHFVIATKEAFKILTKT